MNVLCVCPGNMCRSPMLTALLRDALATEGLGLAVSGAGTGTTDGVPPSPHAITAMHEIGVDIAELRSRQITPAIVEAPDAAPTPSPGGPQAPPDGTGGGGYAGAVFR